MGYFKGGMVLEAPPCKLCDSPAVVPLYRFHHASEAEPFSLLECKVCSFRFIDYLDPPEPSISTSTLEETAANVASGLEFNQECIAGNAALLRSRVSSGKLLDVGCGGGGFLLAVQDQFEVEGVEIDHRLRDYASARGLEVSKRPIEHSSWNARTGDYTAVTLWDVIEHVNHPRQLSRHVHRLLKPGGVMLIDTPSRDGPLYRFGNWLARLTRGRRGATMSMQYSSAPFCHKQIFRPCDMRRMLEAAGFRKIEIEEKFELSFPPEHYTRHFIRSALLRRILNPIVGLALCLAPVRNKMIVIATK